MTDLHDDGEGEGAELSSWLAGLRLARYERCLATAGYRRPADCADLTDERLLELRVFPTGHRRRILRSLEALGAGPGGAGPARADPWRGSQTLPPGVGLGGFQEEEEEGEKGEEFGGGHANRGATATLKPAPRRRPPHPPPPRDPCPPRPASCPASSTSPSSPSEQESCPDLPPPPPPLPLRVEMVENDIYEEAGLQAAAEGAGLTRVGAGPIRVEAGPTRPTRSYRLRHRPVPEIPKQVVQRPQNWTMPRTITAIGEHLPATQGPSAANGKQKAALSRTLTPIAPYGEMFLYNNPENVPDGGARDLPGGEMKEKRKQNSVCKTLLKAQTNSKDQSLPAPPPTTPDQWEDDYATVELANPTPDLLPGPAPEGVMVDNELYSEAGEAWGEVRREALPISPYACFYGAPKTQVKSGWLDKLSPQGNCLFQRRWVRFDGENLLYFSNDKEMYSKGVVPVSVMKQVRCQGDNKFEVVTALRTYVFRAEREAERQEWMEALQAALLSPVSVSQKPRLSLPRRGGTHTHTHTHGGGGGVLRSGCMELRGFKGKVCVSLMETRITLSKTEQDFKAGLFITVVDLAAANIRDADRRSFDVVTPFKSFCFTADSEQEKSQWAESIQECITEALSDYEVAEKIWFDQSNRSCADCSAPGPEWASINLGVVVCKECAGQHRSLGPSLSKVRSLKLDSSVWTNELVELFLEVGNKRANSFWAAHLPPGEELSMGASPEQRAAFHRRKYRDRKYAQVLEGRPDQEQLNQALCSAVLLPDVMETMRLVFSGADVMTTTGDPLGSTPYLLAQRAGHRLTMEFLHHNKLSDFPKLAPCCGSGSVGDAPSFMDGFLFCSSGSSRTPLDRRGRDDLSRRWVTLEGGFLSLYESERSAAASGRVDVSEGVSLAVSHTETMTAAGAVFTLELHLHPERSLLLGAQSRDSQGDWARALAKCFAPSKVEAMLRRGSELIGRLYYKEGHDLYHWRVGWFSLEGHALHFSSGDEGEEPEGTLQLKQLQELTVSTHLEGEERIQVLLMVEGGRTVYVHSFNKADFALWHAAIRLAAGTDGRALGNQQLSKNGVPIVVDSCIAFVTQYGLVQQGVYQGQGDPDRVSRLLDDFHGDARGVKLRLGEHRVDDVTHALRSFLSRADDALLTKELYPYWVSALDVEDLSQRVKKYSTFIHSLPKINQDTLEALLQHLYRVQSCSQLNQVQTSDLARVFSPCLFQTDGQNAQEAAVIHDLIRHYADLFSVSEDQLKLMDRENSFITRWEEKKDAAFSPAGDLIFEVYLEKREPENCCLIKLSPTMRSDALADAALAMRGVATSGGDRWSTVEVIENGELERPLHWKEKVLEQVLEWSSLDDPSSAYLVIKNFRGAKMATDHAGQTQNMRGNILKFKDGSSKLLSGHKFQERYVMLREGRLLLYKDIKSAKPERDVPVSCVKCYLGLKRKLKPPTRWGFTVLTEKQQWHFCCEEKEAQVDWVTAIIRMKYGTDLWTKSGNQRGPAVHKTSTGGVVHRALKSQTLGKHSTIKPPTDGRHSPNISLGDCIVRAGELGHAHLKTPPPGGRLGGADAAGGGRGKRVTLGVVSPSPHQQQRSPAPRPRSAAPASPPTPTPFPRPGRSPVAMAPGGEVRMPPRLFSELSSVLSKTRRQGGGEEEEEEGGEERGGVTTRRTDNIS